MHKLLLCLGISLLAFQANAQVPIKTCPNGTQVFANAQCYSSAPPPPSWTPYAAIAYSPSQQRFYYSYNASSRKTARESALQDCRRETAGQCQLSLEVVGECFAIARGAKYYATSYGGSIERAQARALRTCQGTDNHVCEISASECSKG